MTTTMIIRGCGQEIGEDERVNENERAAAESVKWKIEIHALCCIPAQFWQ